MNAQTAAGITVCVLFGIISVVLVVGSSKYWARRPLASRGDPQLLAYLASRGYANPPSGDPTPSSFRGLYPNIVFGTCGDIAFAFVVSTYRSRTTTAIYAASARARVGAWYCVPRGETDWSARPIGFFGFGGKTTRFSTRDANYDALVETFGEGPDGPSAEVRARVLAFPGGVRSAGWYEGRVMVSLTTHEQLAPVRLDAAFDLVRALFSST